ncbi:hypothetical protein HELRODRAFT_167611 [Helobdella robusta]|uniref:Uncharacterized protein n=1 Tax=Helobdella robusta TaxID=6412 RepID=T1EZK0_HELRO|nr:hypothetical protein HELRODRAFT_167611 [Helobdella robusta]ESO11080.1 hypothetical protein HELRODRAFT_167611 [Helobdella robusta]
MHKRSCQTSKLLYFHPVVDKESASTTATLNNAQKSPSTSTTEGAFTTTTLNSVRLPMPPSSSSGVATSSITELNKVHRSPPPLSLTEATSEFKQINSIQQPTQSSSPMKAHTAPSARPLPGIKLPRTRRDWEEANAYFHAELNSWGDVDDIDKLAYQFNNLIYKYFEKSHGTINKRITIDQNRSINQLKKDLAKLKKIVKNNNSQQIKKEIISTSKLIRTKLRYKKADRKNDIAQQLKNNFWKTCQNIFLPTKQVSPLPNFNNSI